MARTDLLLILRALRLHFSDEDGKKREKEERDYIPGGISLSSHRCQAILLPPHKAIISCDWAMGDQGINHLNIPWRKQRGILLN